jgi:hypothetical protein
MSCCMVADTVDSECPGSAKPRLSILTRQPTSKPLAEFLGSNRLEETGEFWLAIHGEHELIGSEDQPFDDRELCLHPPLKLKSLLPCKTHFILYTVEKKKTDPYRHLIPIAEGNLNAGESIPVHTMNPKHAVEMALEAEQV